MKKQMEMPKDDEVFRLYLFVININNDTTKITFNFIRWSLLFYNVLGENMKTITSIVLFLFLTGCGYTMKLGKKCTPGHQEWSYVWFIEKGEADNVRKSNCK